MADEEKTATFVVLLREYWHAYGGLRELVRSPYLYLAIALTPVMYGEWSHADWWDTVIAVVPVLLGISLAAFTLFLAAGSEGFREVIAGRDSEEVENNGARGEPSSTPAMTEQSPFVRTAAVFLHFLVIQFIALIVALMAKSLYQVDSPHWFMRIDDVVTPVFWAISYFIFMYALTVVLAASFAVYEVVQWFDEYVTNKHQ